MTISVQSLLEALEIAGQAIDVRDEPLGQRCFRAPSQGNFVQRLWQLQGAYACSPNLVLSSFIQYETRSQNVGTNTRLRWTIKPDNDLFIGWNRGWQRLVLSPNDTSIVPQSDLIAVKLHWAFRREKIPASRCSQPECDMLDGLSIFWRERRDSNPQLPA